MILPTNGKVVVFDDVYEDVEGLLKTLSKNKIPYNYYQDEGGEDLPDTPINNVRLIFLDIQLISGQSVSDHSIRSTIGIRLQKILEKNNNYILIYWSTKENKYKDMLEDAFENGLKDYKPILTLSINKVEALKKGDKIVDFIINEIEEKSDDFSLFKVFALWENLVSNSAGNLINDFTNFIGKDENWDDSAKYVLHKISQAYSGKTINNKSEIEKLGDAFSTLNQTLIDTIENNIPKVINEHKSLLKDIISNEKKGNENFSSIINNKLLLSELEFNGNVPGCLFLIEEEIEAQNETIEHQFKKEIEKLPSGIENREQIISKKKLRNKDKINALVLHSKGIEKNFNIIVNSVINAEEEAVRKSLRDRILKDSIKIELNVSPLCDFAQEKLPCVRLLPGLLLKSDYGGEINRNSAYNYLSDCIIKFRDSDYYFLFDFRFLYSKPEKLLKRRISNNKLRHQILSDIQLKLGSHVNRPGVIYVE